MSPQGRPTTGPLPRGGTITRMPLADAEATAITFAALLDGTFERLAVAGSIRRRLPTVGGIEIVATPTVEEVPQMNLFGEAVLSVTIDRMAERLDALVADGAIQRRRRADGRFCWGPSMKLLTFNGALIDLFVPEADRFGWVYAIRTGPSAFSNALVTMRGERTRSGRAGLMPEWYAARDGWLVERMTGQRIATPHEADVFRLLGLDPVDPWERV